MVAPVTPDEDIWWIDDCVGSMIATGASPTKVILPTAPMVGRYWQITSVSVVGSDDHSQLANTFCVFCIGDPGAAPISDVRIPGSYSGTANSVPSGWNGDLDTLAVVPPYRPYALIYGLAAGQPVTVIVNGWDRPLRVIPRSHAIKRLARHHLLPELAKLVRART